jgi:hypothetical protein
LEKHARWVAMPDTMAGPNSPNLVCSYCLFFVRRPVSGCNIKYDRTLASYGCCGVHYN